MSSDDSDIDIRSALTKKQNKIMPNSPTEEILEELSTNNKELPSKTKNARTTAKQLSKKITEKKTKKKKEEEVLKNSLQKEDTKKITTKLMVNQALKDLKSKNGVSLYAIKKYLKENFEVNTEKLNYIIKKAIKKSIEDGTIVQIKGTGASGSFKLAPEKPTKTSIPKKPKIIEEDKEKLKIMMKNEKIEKKENSEKPKKLKSKESEKEEKQVKKKVVKEKKVASAENKKIKPKMKSAIPAPTPAKKKAAMITRKSIGKIIKPPKMKPKAIAQ